MTDVACFYGCCYSFSGAAGPCPVCGELAIVSARPAHAHTGRAGPRAGPLSSAMGSGHWLLPPGAQDRLSPYAVAAPGRRIEDQADP
jgi:hypothetical protein